MSEPDNAAVEERGRTMRRMARQPRPPQSSSGFPSNRFKSSKEDSNGKGVPGYAKTTIASSQRTNSINIRSPSLKAGPSYSKGVRSASTRPSSASRSRHGDPPITADKSPGHSSTRLRKQSSLVDLFGNFSSDESGHENQVPFPGTIDGPFNLNGKLVTNQRKSSYSSPSIIKKVDIPTTNEGNLAEFNSDPKKLDFNSLIEETDSLIGNISVNDDLMIYDSSRFKDLFRLSTDLDEVKIERIAKYHDTVIGKFREKVKLDHQVIQNILELNNRIASHSKSSMYDDLGTTNKDVAQIQDYLSRSLNDHGKSTFSGSSVNTVKQNKADCSQLSAEKIYRKIYGGS